MPPVASRPSSALPSVRARVLAFAAIVVSGVCGGLIGASFERLQCRGGCTTQMGLGGIVGAALAASGVAVVAVLTLRAMGEWRRISDEALLATGAGAGARGDHPGGDDAAPPRDSDR